MPLSLPQRPEIYRACFVSHTVETRWLVARTGKMLSVIQRLPPGTAPVNHVTRHEKDAGKTHAYFDTRRAAVRQVLLHIREEIASAKSSFQARMSILRHQACMLRKKEARGG